MKQNKWLKILSCSVFAGLYLIVAVISLICSTKFFNLAHSGIMSWVLAIGFEVGAMSCLLSTLILPKNKLGLVWFMFIVLTLFQCMGNMYAAFINLENFQDWIDMFGLSDMELISQKRILAAISGIILPLVALGFIRIMADVLQDGHEIEINGQEQTKTEKTSNLSSDNETAQELTKNDIKSQIINEPIETLKKTISAETAEKITDNNNKENDSNIEQNNIQNGSANDIISEEPTKTAEDHDKKVLEKTNKKKFNGPKIWDSALNAELG